MIHFWAPAGTASADDVLAWNPDLEPDRFATGFGHAMLELYTRLARGGLEVSLGHAVPAGTRLVVVFPKSVYQESRLRAVLGEGRRSGGRFAVVRSDTPLSWRFPVRPVVEFMPNRQAVRRPWQQWLPPLPQRGLVPRRAERRGRIRSVAFKGYVQNVPSELRTAEWADALGSRDIEWLADVATDADGAGQRWHDFASVDAVLCVRAGRSARNTERKPATRLINAWSAGSVPLAERDPAYVELGSEGSDVFFVDSPFEALPVIDRLNADSELLMRVERQIELRAAEFSLTKTLEHWRTALIDAATSPRARRSRVQVVRVTGARVGVDVRMLLRPARTSMAQLRARAARWKRGVLRART